MIINKTDKLNQIVSRYFDREFSSNDEFLVGDGKAKVIMSINRIDGSKMFVHVTKLTDERKNKLQVPFYTEITNERAMTGISDDRIDWLLLDTLESSDYIDNEAYVSTLLARNVVKELKKFIKKNQEILEVKTKFSTSGIYSS